MLRRAFIVASCLLPVPVGAIPLAGGQVLMYQYYGVVREGETDSWHWNDYLPYLILPGYCLQTLTSMSFRFEPLPYSATGNGLYSVSDELNVRIMVIERSSVVYRDFRILGSSPLLELEFISPDSCTHFWVSGISVETVFTYHVESYPTG